MADSTNPEPTDSLCMFGAVVQGLREQAGLSREEFGRLVQFSKHTVASVELGRRMPDVGFVTAAGEVLGQPEVLRRTFEKVSRKRPGLATWFRRWAELEAEAITPCTYECRLLPGLLQTPAYARTLFEHQLPSLDDAQIDAQLQARLERQRLLRERPDTTFSFVLEEHFFLRRMGGDEVTRELISHVLGMAELRNVEFQIMPVIQHTHAGLDGPMQLLETSENQWCAYSEVQRGGLFITIPGKSACSRDGTPECARRLARWKTR